MRPLFLSDHRAGNPAANSIIHPAIAAIVHDDGCRRLGGELRNLAALSRADSTGSVNISGCANRKTNLPICGRLSMLHSP